MAVKVANRDIEKMLGYYLKGSKPDVLANTVKDLDKAKSLLTNEEDPDESYLRAIIAARKGEAGNCERELAKAYVNSKYEARADNDIEFAALQ